MAFKKLLEEANVLVEQCILFKIKHLTFMWLPCSSFIFLFLENYGVRKLEAFFAVLIAIMALSFAWMFGEAKPDGVDVLVGKQFISSI